MDARQQLQTADRHRLFGIVFGVGTQILFLPTVWQLFWFLRDGSTGDAANWLLRDLLLSLQFVVVHGLLLLPRVRSRITRRLPAGLYGSLFCVATCIGLWLIFGLWRASPLVVWQTHGVAAAATRAGFYCSWVGLFYSLHLSGFGYQTGWTPWLLWLRRQPLPSRGLVERGAYRWLRHPAYMGFLGLIWFTPRMTLDHAVLTAVWTAYVFFGSWLKDRRLEFYLGDVYREYASRVPGYPGMFVGPLGKWPPRVETPMTAGGSPDQHAFPRAA